jgi:predicted transposase/invertase (TIGR01784 family)
MAARKVRNPHDVFFKQTLARPGVAADFLRRYLPPRIVRLLDLRRLAIEKESFVDAKLRQHFSDLLVRVGLRGRGEAYVYILLEHKSAPEEWVALQLLRYVTHAWERLRRAGGRLPLIIPVVFYHGAAPWRVSTKLSALLAEPDLARRLRRYVPDFEYHLCDLAQYRDEQLQGVADLPASLRLMKHMLRGDLKRQLPAIFRAVLERLPEREVEERVETMVRYALAAERVTEGEIATALETAEQIGGEQMETFFDKMRKKWRIEGLQEGRQIGRQIGRQEGRRIGRQEGLRRGLREGRREGKQEGKQEALVEMSLRLLRRRLGRLDAETQQRILTLSLRQLRALSEALLDFQTREDLARWLNRRRKATPQS